MNCEFEFMSSAVIKYDSRDFKYISSFFNKPFSSNKEILILLFFD